MSLFITGVVQAILFVGTTTLLGLMIHDIRTNSIWKD